ncbi:hypothetical protein SUGI_0028460 [Cryptomeria japonica]|nr:hypothetical protein SUGI_0028460 [Cryptomeria japonica]
MKAPLKDGVDFSERVKNGLKLHRDEGFLWIRQACQRRGREEHVRRPRFNRHNNQDGPKRRHSFASSCEEKSCGSSGIVGETPLKLAVSLGFKEAVEFLNTRTSNALHYIVELNQVKLVQFLIDKNVDLSKLINKYYQPTDGGEQHPKEKVPTNESADRGGQSLQTRNKYDHMVNLLLKVRKVDKLARNGEDKTPFEIAREVTKYHESFRIIRKLADCRESPKSFMDCAAQVTHEKRIEARKMVGEAYKARRDAELVVAALLAAMTCARRFRIEEGFKRPREP